MSPEIEVSGVEGVVDKPNGGVVVKVIARTSRLGESSTELEIAMDPSVALATAIALLVTAATARAGNGVGQPALQVLAAAVVASGSAEKVHVQLLLHDGPVIPIELPVSAAELLKLDLVKSLHGSLEVPDAQAQNRQLIANHPTLAGAPPSERMSDPMCTTQNESEPPGQASMERAPRQS